MESASGPNSLHLRGIVWFPFWWHGWKWICVEPRQGYAGYAIPPSFSLSLSAHTLNLAIVTNTSNSNSYGIKLTAFVLRFPPRVLYAAGPVPPRQILQNTTQVWIWVDQVSWSLCWVYGAGSVMSKILSRDSRVFSSCCAQKIIKGTHIMTNLTHISMSGVGMHPCEM